MRCGACPDAEVDKLKMTHPDMVLTKIIAHTVITKICAVSPSFLSKTGEFSWSDKKLESSHAAGTQVQTDVGTQDIFSSTQKEQPKDPLSVQGPVLGKAD